MATDWLILHKKLRVTGMTCSFLVGTSTVRTQCERRGSPI